MTERGTHTHTHVKLIPFFSSWERICFINCSSSSWEQI